MTPQRPATSEIETDASDRTLWLALRQTLVAEWRDDYSVVSIVDALVETVERIVAERVRVVEGERDEWKSRRDAAIEQCRHLHQDGKTREQWHLDNCGAMRALRVATARAESAEAAHESLRAGVEALADYLGTHGRVERSDDDAWDTGWRRAHVSIETRLRADLLAEGAE